MFESTRPRRAACLRGLLRGFVIAFALGAGAAFAAARPAVVATGLQFPEGLVFVGDTLYFVDYSASDVLRLKAGRVERVWHQQGCGTNGLARVPSGLLVACYDSGLVVRITLDGTVDETIRADDKGRAFTAPNDLAADARGGVYFTASGSGAVPGKVFYRGADRHVVEVASDIQNANGVVVSLDGKHLYLGESGKRRLLVFDISDAGALSNQREFVQLGAVLSSPGQAEFVPDGVGIDAHGNLFVALYRGGGFAVISPQGKLVREVDLPGSHHSNLAISPDGKQVFLSSIDGDPAGGYRGELIEVPNPVSP
jgi:gluconolactonase